MRLAKHDNALKTNTQVESQEFGIGDASVIIEILRNKMYRHPIRTLVQEYISNGRDAMREVGSKRAIDITIPNQLHPTFKVRDYGPGVDPDRIKNVFILYGASTKRDSNFQTGGFGLGAKSAWSYTDSFTIKTFVDGTMRSYVAHTGVNNNGRLDLISTDKTDEPNGTEIQIGVNPSDLHAFQEASRRAVYFWDDKTYNFKGTAEAMVRQRGSEVVPGLEVLPSSALPNFVKGGYGSEMLAIIDGIPYKLEDNFLDIPELRNLDDLCTGQILLHVDTGLLEVAATRESVSDSKQSKDAFAKLASEYIKHVSKYIKSEFAKAKTVADWVSIHNDLSKKFAVAGLDSYKGYSLKYNRLENDTVFSEVCIISADMRNGKLFKTEQKNLNANNTDRWFFFDSGESKVVQNKRIREFLSPQNGNRHGSIIVITPKDGKKSVYDKMKKDLELKDLTSITYTETPKTISPKVIRSKKEFCVHDFTHWRREHVYLTLSGNTKKWLWVPLKGDKYSKHNLTQLAKYVGTNVCAVGVEAEKLIKGNANFVSVDKFLADFKPSKKEIATRMFDSRKNSHDIKAIRLVKDLNDKFLIKMIAEYESLKSATIIPALLIKKCENIKEVQEFKVRDKKLKNLFDTVYPLVRDLNYVCNKNLQEIKFYMNAKFKTLQGSK